MTVCVLCARRDRTTRLEVGHCCVACAARLATDIADIARLAADAAAYVMPGSSTGTGARTVPGSRPPCRVEAIDPHLTVIDGQALTVLECLELWERMVREARGMARYGPVSAARASDESLLHAGADVTLVGCVRFLGAQVAWMTTEVEFPVDDFADEIRLCLRHLRRWDPTAEDRGQMVACPTITDNGECGTRLSYRDWDEHVTCPRCGQTRDAATLALIAMSDGREVWLDPEAAAQWLCVSEATLRRMARRGEISRSHGRYLMPSTTAV